MSDERVWIACVFVLVATSLLAVVVVSGAAVAVSGSAVTVSDSAAGDTGVDLIGADEAHERNVTGANVTVAVIDSGFDPDHEPIADNVVAVESVGDEEDLEETEHGTATAEVLTQVAPNVDLVLVEAATDEDVLEGISYVESETDAAIVTMSMGFLASPLDGTDLVSQRVTQSVEEDEFVWFNAAGNSADGWHWNGTWQDEHDDQLTFEPGERQLEVSVPRGSEADIWVQWNRWGDDQSPEYHLRLLDARTGQEVASSEREQRNGEPPREGIRDIESGEYHLEIHQSPDDENSPVVGDHFSVFTNGAELDPSTSTQSVIPPATGVDSIAVGALSADDETLEPFSGRGPTIDGRLKPDLVAPSGVDTTVGGNYAPYRGTSAAAPHAAGVAALVLSNDHTLDPETTRARLLATATAVDDTPDGPNNETGYGLVNAGQALPCGTVEDDDRLFSDARTNRTCISLPASGITFDGQHNVIRGENEPGEHAISVSGDDVTVTNVSLARWNGSLHAGGQNVTGVDVTLADDRTLAVPAFVATDLTLDIAIDAPEHEGAYSLGRYLTLSPESDSISFEGEIAYESGDITAGNASALGLWAHGGDGWQPLDAVQDADRETVATERPLDGDVLGAATNAAENDDDETETETDVTGVDGPVTVGLFAEPLQTRLSRAQATDVYAVNRTQTVSVILDQLREDKADGPGDTLVVEYDDAIGVDAVDNETVSVSLAEDDVNLTEELDDSELPDGHVGIPVDAVRVDAAASTLVVELGADVESVVRENGTLRMTTRNLSFDVDPGEYALDIGLGHGNGTGIVSEGLDSEAVYVTAGTTFSVSEVPTPADAPGDTDSPADTDDTEPETVDDPPDDDGFGDGFTPSVVVVALALAVALARIQRLRSEG